MNKILNKWVVSLAALVSVGLLMSCNKDLPGAVPVTQPQPTGQTILQMLDAPDFSVLKAAVAKASTFNSTTGNLSQILGDSSATLTFFAPDNTAILTSFSLLGLPADPSTLDYFSAGQLDSLLKYHLIGGEKFTTARINTTSPGLNMYLQSMLLLAAPSPSLPPGYRMPVFLSKQGPAAFVNNVPVTGPDMAAANGVMHKIAIALMPPDKVLWQTIYANADNSYTYFKEAIIRADGGVNPAGTFQSALSSPNANFTALIPTNTAFQQLLTGQITLALMQQGVPQANAQTAAAGLVAGYGPTIISDPASIPMYGPQLAAVITPQLLQGVVAYHLLAQPGTTVFGYRDFTVNFPAGAAVNVPTLVNASVPAHPGVALQATFGPGGVTSATAKGVGNTSAANIQLNPLPGGTSDQNHVNGVIHRIDQVLLPQ